MPVGVLQVVSVGCPLSSFPSWCGVVAPIARDFRAGLEA